MKLKVIKGLTVQTRLAKLKCLGQFGLLIINEMKNTSHFNILNMIAKIIADINLHG